MLFKLLEKLTVKEAYTEEDLPEAEKNLKDIKDHFDVLFKKENPSEEDNLELSATGSALKLAEKHLETVKNSVEKEKNKKFTPKIS